MAGLHATAETQANQIMAAARKLMEDGKYEEARQMMLLGQGGSM